MSTPPPEPANRRKELLTIAVKLFAEHGVANTTVREIADAAGILSGSLYHHFSSKNQIVAEAIGGGLIANVAANRATIDAAPNSATALVRLISSAVRWVGKEPDVAKILSNDKAYIRDNADLFETEERRQEARLEWINLVERGIAEGIFRPVGSVDVLVRSIFDGIYGTSRWMYGELTPKQVAMDLAKFYLHGLLADGYRYDFETHELITDG